MPKFKLSLPRISEFCSEFWKAYTQEGYNRESCIFHFVFYSYDWLFQHNDQMYLLEQIVIIKQFSLLCSEAKAAFFPFHSKVTSLLTFLYFVQLCYYYLNTFYNFYILYNFWNKLNFYIWNSRGPKQNHLFIMTDVEWQNQ